MYGGSSPSHQVPQYGTGDVVKILDDIAMVHDLQEGHGGWVDDMALVSLLLLSTEKDSLSLTLSLSLSLPSYFICAPHLLTCSGSRSSRACNKGVSIW